MEATFKFCNHKFNKFYFLFLLLLFSKSADARWETANNRLPLQGNTASVSSSMTVDAVPSSITLNFNDPRVYNIVSLKFDHTYTQFIPSNKVVEVDLKIDYYDINGTYQSNNSVLSKIFKVEVIPFTDLDPFIDLYNYVFDGAYKLVITINSIKINGTNQNDLPPYVYIESEIQIERFYEFPSSNSTVTFNPIVDVDFDCDGLMDEIIISWQDIEEAEEYQLEWTHTNNYTTVLNTLQPANLVNYDFKNNSSRVTTIDAINNIYKLSLLFDRGYVVFRIRAVGRDYLDPDKFIYGEWNTVESNDIGFVLANFSNSVYQITSGINGSIHEYMKNWQLSTTFAEEGKKKEVINYFDGAFYNRQTVTRNNSDKRVLVGETYYDYAGRPAINVLPTPVPEPVSPCSGESAAIRYYYAYNLNSNSDNYSKSDYAEDNGNCEPAAGVMNNSSGASQYYSENNPEISKREIKFIPDAEGYPFTQTQYTPDNTGKISKQSGVGANHQFGSDHETKYLYGQPNQVQLDRLFGSEAGKESHYKKNVVIDPNKQTSITYLDQAGRTIATSLAGVVPSNLIELESVTGSEESITFDLFNKNPDGSSPYNKPNEARTAIVFTKQLIVPFESDYEFTYTLEFDTLGNPCNPNFNNVCFNCIYNLKISVTDNECGEEKISNGPIEEVIGHFIDNGNGTISFTTSCNNDNPFIMPTKNFIIEDLPPGEYTVTKTLTINQEAKQFYINEYLKAENNPCYYTQQEVITEAAAQLNFDDCEPSCQDCLDALGTKDNYIANGGTAFQYDMLVEKCTEPCKPISVCQSTYVQLLADVSIHGQYGLLNADNTASDILSVFNSSNRLPGNYHFLHFQLYSPYEIPVVVDKTASWRNPKITINGVEYDGYYNDDNERVEVRVIYDGATADPEVLDPAKIYFNSVEEYHYTWPENLKNVQDFISDYWDMSFARSLVKYHPEYPYYLSCIKHSYKYGTSTMSSDEFDYLISVIDIYSDAETEGFITNQQVDLLSKDPFFAQSSPGASYLTQMQNKINNYFTFNAIPYSMEETAALFVRCGKDFGLAIAPACTTFGAPSSINNDIINQEWNTYKSFYLSEKQKIIYGIMQKDAVLCNNLPPGYNCSGFNGCIGNENFNPFYSGNYSWHFPIGCCPLTMPNLLDVVSFPPLIVHLNYQLIPFYNPYKTGSFWNYHYFSKKLKRFVAPAEIPGINPDNAAAQLYQMTGQCPITMEFQFLLSEMAEEGVLSSPTDVHLNSLSFYTQNLYKAISGGIYPSNLIDYILHPLGILNGVLSYEIQDPSGTKICDLVIDLSSSTITNPNDILNFVNLQFDNYSNGLFYFTAKAVIAHPTDPNQQIHEEITGYTCINIRDCKFEPECIPNELATNLQLLMSFLLSNNDLEDASVDFSVVNQNNTLPLFYKNVVAPELTAIKNLLNPANNSNEYIWECSSTTLPWTAKFYFKNDPSKYLEITIDHSDHLSFPSFNNTIPPNSQPPNNDYLIGFANIKPNYFNRFTMDAVDDDGEVLAKLKGSVIFHENVQDFEVSMGDCKLPDPVDCIGANQQTIEDLHNLIEYVLLNQDPVTPLEGVDLYTTGYMTGLLQSYIQGDLTSTSSTYVNDFEEIEPDEFKYDTLDFNMPECEFILYRYDLTPPDHSFLDITAISELTAYGEMDEFGFYNEFYFIATFGTNPDTQFEDTIFGRSCFKIKNCITCEDEEDPERLANANFSAEEQIRFDKDRDIKTLGIFIKYKMYEKIADSLNAVLNIDKHNQKLISKVSYEDFIKNDLQNTFDTYLKFVTNYNPLIDDESYLDINTFRFENGNYTNCVNEYKRYVKAIETYNKNINTTSKKEIISVIPDSVFYRNLYCDNISDYIKYIFNNIGRNNIKNETDLAGITDFFENNELSKVSNDECYGLYLDYLDAYNYWINSQYYQSECLFQYANGLFYNPLPLYSFSYFVMNGFCCDNNAINDFSAYINDIYNATNDCPPLGPTLNTICLTDYCELLYDYYLQTYDYFIYYQANIQNTCPGYRDIPYYDNILYFQDNNLCCPEGGEIGYAAFLSYIMSFYTTTGCPDELPHSPRCGTDDCEYLYSVFINMVKNYNLSFYAIKHNYYLNEYIYTSYQDFYDAGLCICVDEYILYLAPYLTTTDMSLPNPKDINHFPDCQTTTSLTDLCEETYNTYTDAVTNYNTWAQQQLPAYPTATVLSLEIYILNSYCNCLTKYLATLDYIMSGQISPEDVSNGRLDEIVTACDPLPCTDEFEIPPIIFPEPPPINDCEETMTNYATSNAIFTHQTLVNNLISDFSEKYDDKCLSALETFFCNYTDKEYHFTLYYYDQAGNLVKTIPPDGVEILPITSSTDQLSLDIADDRANNKHTVFTNHRLPTVYEYNSLNQLTRQVMPDHDRMDIKEFNRPMGLNKNLQVMNSQFVGSSYGFLSGSVGSLSYPTRGYLYSSSDAGMNWNRMNGLVASDLKKIKFLPIDNHIGYAVGSHGIILRTRDHGNSWDALNLYNVASKQYTSDITSIAVNNASTGSIRLVVGGQITGSGAAQKGIYISSDGINFSGNSVGFEGGDNITSLFYLNGSGFYATANKSTELPFGTGVFYDIGKIYFGSTNGAIWTKHSLISNVANLYTSQYMNNNHVYAAGEKGTFVHGILNVTTWNWLLVPTRIIGDFRDIYFKSALEGVAIVTDNAGDNGKIYKTFDGGYNWYLLSDPADEYLTFEVYDKTNHKLTANGKNGLVARVLLDGTSFGIIKLTKPTSTSGDHIVSSTAFINNSFPQTVCANNSASTPTLYYTPDATGTNVTWSSHTFTGANLPANGIRKIVIDKLAIPGDGFCAVLIDNDGKLFTYYHPNSTTLPAQISLNQPPVAISHFFSDITPGYFDGSIIRFFAFEKNSKQAYKVEFNATASYAQSATVTNTAVQSGDITNISYYPTQDAIVVSGDGGVFYQQTNLQTSGSWNLGSKNLIPSTLNATVEPSTGDLLVVGNGGAAWKLPSGGSYFEFVQTGTTEDIISGAFETGTGGIFGTSSGNLITADASLNFSPLSGVNTGSEVKDIAQNGNEVYAVGSNGKITYIDDITATTITATNPLTGNNAGSLNAITLKDLNGTKVAYAAGDYASIYYLKGANESAKINEIFLPGIRASHFTNALNGYVIADNGNIRYTNDGGNKWQIVLPKIADYSKIANINRVWTVKPGEALAVGNSEYVALLKNTDEPEALTVTGGNSSNILNDINFYNSDYGVIVGSQGTDGKTYSVVPSGNSYSVAAISGTAGTSTLRAVHVFSDNTFIAAGNQGNIQFYNGSGFSSQSNGVSTGDGLTDIYFHDDRTGYVVGRTGVAYKCNHLENIQGSGTAITWSPFDLVDGVVYTSPPPNNINIMTLAFADRYRGFFGGVNTAVNPQGKYAMLVNDESEYYSTRYWYDRLGRLILSQNAKQSNPSVKKYSYTLFDALGRIIETGEKTENTGQGELAIADIFGTNVNGTFNPQSGGSTHFNPLTINDTKFHQWIGESGARTEVVQTWYDAPQFTITGVSQENLRNRVASITLEDVYDADDQTYQAASHYTYDIHGNVKTLWQENKQITSIPNPQNLKRIDYDYDLISGVVKKVKYQDGKPDRFYHRYEYDADNRLKIVETSINDVIYDLDAKYFYYPHGPLSRVEYGHNKVQGIDYAYTIQGWIKGINSNLLKPELDMGLDGFVPGSGTNDNSVFARDVMGYSLGYYDGDYTPIDAATTSPNVWTQGNRWEADIAGSNIETAKFGLFNGNISHMVTALPTEQTLASTGAEMIHKPLGVAYRYDQLNRLINAIGFENLENDDQQTDYNQWKNEQTPQEMYQNEFTYDANGNILTQVRKDETNASFDELEYKYKEDASGNRLQNRLYHVDDAITNSTPADDIEDQGTFTSNHATINTANNYSYDELGNLVKDTQEEIYQIEWTVTGKIKRIIRTATSIKPHMEFRYDAMGNRIMKIVKPDGTSGENGENFDDTEWTITHYIRDAQGNVMATYEEKYVNSQAEFMLTERNIYGSSRIGMNAYEADMYNATVGTDDERLLGKKYFELTNHLGNVLTVITDRKYATTTNGTSISGWLADVKHSSDYSPFGAMLYGRDFKTVQCTDVTNVTTIEDLTNDFSSGTENYTAYNNTSISASTGALKIERASGSPTIGASKAFTITQNGSNHKVEFKLDIPTSLGKDVRCLIDNTVIITVSTTGVTTHSISIGTLATGSHTIKFETVGTVSGSNKFFYVDDVKVKYDVTSVTTTCNDEPGIADYRYGFGGHEKDDEIKGSDNSYTTSERFYDPRLGRWLKPDLLEAEAPSWTPYRYAFDNPLRFSDPDGNFEIDEATAAAYPKLNTYLQNIAKEYAGKPEAFRKAFKEYGQLSDAQVNKMLEYKLVKNGTPISANQDNPRIMIAAMTNNNGETMAKVSIDGSGNMIVSNTGIIKLNKNLAENFEKDHSTNVEAEGAKILLESTLFHEGTHYGDNLDGTSDKTPIGIVGGKVTLTGGEGGKAFENKAYGRDIGNGATYNDVIKDANKYANDNNINGAVFKDYVNQEIQKSRDVPTDKTRVDLPQKSR